MRAQLEANEILDEFVSCIQKDDSMHTITWNINGCKNMTDQAAKTIVEGFSSNLEAPRVDDSDGADTLCKLL